MSEFVVILVVIFFVSVSVACAIRWTTLQTHIVEIYVKSIMVSSGIAVMVTLGVGCVLGFVGSMDVDGALAGTFLAGVFLAVGGLPLVLLASTLGALLGVTPAYILIRRSNRTPHSGRLSGED